MDNILQRRSQNSFKTNLTNMSTRRSKTVNGRVQDDFNVDSCPKLFIISFRYDSIFACQHMHGFILNLYARRSKICQRTSHRWWSECTYCFHGSSAQFGWCVECKAVRGSVGIGWSAYWRQAHGSRSGCGSSTGWFSKYVWSLWCTEALFQMFCLSQKKPTKFMILSHVFLIFLNLSPDHPDVLDTRNTIQRLEKLSEWEMITRINNLKLKHCSQIHSLKQPFNLNVCEVSHNDRLYWNRTNDKYVCFVYTSCSTIVTKEAGEHSFF